VNDGIRLRPMVHVTDMAGAVSFYETLGAERLRAAGAPVTQPVQKVGIGRQLQPTSPDGLLIKIDELDPNQFS
jgi:hypothetical protein